jgi:hypothetical protein
LERLGKAEEWRRVDDDQVILFLGFGQELIEDAAEAIGGVARYGAGGEDVEIRIGRGFLTSAAPATGPSVGLPKFPSSSRPRPESTAERR